MNNILVINNNVCDIENEYISISNNEIIFKKSCDYNIFYQNSNYFDIKIKILDNVYVKLFEYMCDLEVNSNIVYDISDNGSLILYKFYCNENVNEHIIVNLNGYMSRFNYYFSNICNNNEKYNLVINHNNSNSISNISNKSICLDNACIDFNIDTIVDKGNICCVMNQDTRIVNFGENKSNIKPNMYISEDDVEARHSSVIGKFNEDEVFYLMTRGIDYNNAIKLLVKGFIFSNLVVDMDKRSKILSVINKYWR